MEEPTSFRRPIASPRFVAQGEEGQAHIIAAATDGKPTEEVAANVRALLEKNISQKFGVPYTKTTYKPMRELIDPLSN